jgi:hypothetical protein
MKLWYDYDEAGAALGLKPSTIKKYCDEGRFTYIVKHFNVAGVRRWRYRVIPASEILRFQARSRSRRTLQW